MRKFEYGVSCTADLKGLFAPLSTASVSESGKSRCFRVLIPYLDRVNQTHVERMTIEESITHTRGHQTAASVAKSGTPMTSYLSL